MPETITELESRIRRAIAPGFQGRLLDRGLARGLIWRNGELPSEAPPFSRSLTEDLLDFAHALLGMSLRLRDAAPNHGDLRRAFLLAGEAIEAAVHRGEPDRLDRGMHRITAAVAFHLARYAARAYSILPADSLRQNLAPSEAALGLLLRRQLDELHDTFAAWLLNAQHGDDAVAERLEEDDNFDDGDAIHEVLTTALMRGLALFDHAIATGSNASADHAREVLVEAASAAADLHAVPHWWTLTLAAHLIEDLWAHSLHQRLPTLPPDDQDADWNALRRSYISRLRRAGRAAIELWPSQLEGAARAVDPTDSLVIAVPTSAGKTRIAELCILRALAGKQRIVYVTPLRALSAQVERDLSSTFGPLGFVVSSLYGSAGIEAGDSDTLRDGKIVVSTPEKLDFALRNDPDIIDDVGLIVLDEGHTLGPGEREVRYEALVTRLLRREDAQRRRMVCLSALFPDVEQMADLVGWIRRDAPGSAVHSDWRPTRQRYGWIRWEGAAARLQARVEDEESFVPRFVEAQAAPPLGRRKNDFPQDKDELTLAAAWQFVEQDKEVLVYCSLRRSVEKLGRLVLKLGRQGWVTPVVTVTNQVREAIDAGTEWLGADHPAVRCLDYGVALHHGGLPRQFLHQVERLLRRGGCRITIASPTLAQGLNLSASVLLIPSIWRNREKIPAVELANVAGRAGRAFVDLEGLVLHVVREADPGTQTRRIRDWDRLVSEAKAKKIRSGILELVTKLLIAIAKAAELDLEEVLEYVTGNSAAWDFSEAIEKRTETSSDQWERDVSSLDAAILALMEVEADLDNLDERLSTVLDGSLFSRQIAEYEEQVQELLMAFLAARARLIWSRTSPERRRAYHVAGVGLRAGEFLDGHLDELLEQLAAAEETLATGDTDAVAEALISFAALVFQIAPFRPRKLPSSWEDTLSAWLAGNSASEVVRSGGSESVDFLHDGIMYGLAWAAEAVRVHGIAVGHPDAKVLEGRAALAIEAGSSSVSAITLIRSGLQSRDAAHLAVTSTRATFSDRVGMLEWLLSEDVQELHRDEDWPSRETRSAWVRFVESIAAGELREWRYDRQVARVDWLDTVDLLPGTYVVLEQDPKSGEVVVLLPDFTHVGRLRSTLRWPRRDIVKARVARRRGRIHIGYFGPRSL